VLLQSAVRDPGMFACARWLQCSQADRHHIKQDPHHSQDRQRIFRCCRRVGKGARRSMNSPKLCVRLCPRGSPRQPAFAWAKPVPRRRPGDRSNAERMIHHGASDFAHPTTFAAFAPRHRSWIELRYARMAAISSGSKTNSGISGWPTESPSASDSANPSMGYLRDRVRNGGAAECGLSPVRAMAWQRAHRAPSNSSPRPSSFASSAIANCEIIAPAIATTGSLIGECMVSVRR
jgi:hypothetical protein